MHVRAGIAEAVIPSRRSRRDREYITCAAAAAGHSDYLLPGRNFRLRSCGRHFRMAPLANEW